MRACPKVIARTTAVIWMLAGCAGTHVHEPAAAGSVAAAEVDALASARGDALERQVDVLSPRHFRDASRALRQAEHGLADGDEPRVTLDHVATGRASLEKANVIAGISRARIGGVVEARSAAIRAGARELMSADFEQTDVGLTDTTEAIEDARMMACERNRAVLTKQYEDAELGAIEIDRLGAAAASVDRSEKAGRRRRPAPALAEALRALGAPDAPDDGRARGPRVTVVTEKPRSR